MLICLGQIKIGIAIVLLPVLILLRVSEAAVEFDDSPPITLKFDALSPERLDRLFAEPLSPHSISFVMLKKWNRKRDLMKSTSNGLQSKQI